MLAVLKLVKQLDLENIHEHWEPLFVNLAFVCRKQRLGGRVLTLHIPARKYGSAGYICGQSLLENCALYLEILTNILQHFSPKLNLYICQRIIFDRFIVLEYNLFIIYLSFILMNKYFT